MKKKFVFPQRVAVLYGGVGPERSISRLTGENVLKGLQEAGFQSLPVFLKGKQDFSENRLIERLRRVRAQAVFIALHGPYGEDGRVQVLLEKAGFPYTGSPPLACALSFHKGYAKMIWEAKGLPTPPWHAYSRLKNKRSRWKPRGLPLPVVIKPVDGGSSVGTSIVRKRWDYRKAFEKAFAVSRHVLEEAFVEGHEVTVGVVGKKVFPVMEIVPKGDFYDWNAKYLPGGSRHIVSPRLPEKTLREVVRIAKAAGEALGCAGYYRVDLIVPKRKSVFRKPQLLEINTVPGMTKTSLLPEMAKASGWTFPRLLKEIVKLAVKRGVAV